MDRNFNHFGYRVIHFDLYKSDIKVLREEWKEFVRNIKPYPSDFNGRGIVMCAGGLGYFTCCWVAVQAIRRTGCRLPVQVWYVGRELSDEIKAALGKLNVTCINFLDYKGGPRFGYCLKPFAIMNTSFKEVLYVDADNICVRNPEELFAGKEYQELGAVFWPDFWKTARENPIWAIVGSTDYDIREQESGQILINKERCWKELNLCMYFNNRFDIYYRLLLGDKDTFKFAWMACKTPFHMIQTEVATLGYENEATGKFIGTTMVQHNVSGEICFLHRNLLKWDITQPGEYVWQKIKGFRKNAVTKEYHINYTTELGHAYMDLKGDVDEIDFREVLGNIEQDCLESLEILRNSDMYCRYMIFQHIKTYRLSVADFI
jgi:alpha 1,2-mannosyltransferase